MDQDEKVRENRLRRMAARQGLRLEKIRRRDPRATDYRRYHLVNPANRRADRKGITLDQVEAWLTRDPEASR